MYKNVSGMRPSLPLGVKKLGEGEVATMKLNNLKEMLTNIPWFFNQ